MSATTMHGTARRKAWLGSSPHAGLYAGADVAVLLDRTLARLAAAVEATRPSGSREAHALARQLRGLNAAALLDLPPTRAARLLADLDVQIGALAGRRAAP